MQQLGNFCMTGLGEGFREAGPVAAMVLLAGLGREPNGVTDGDFDLVIVDRGMPTGAIKEGFVGVKKVEHLEGGKAGVTGFAQGSDRDRQHRQGDGGLIGQVGKAAMKPLDFLGRGDIHHRLAPFWKKPHHLPLLEEGDRLLAKLGMTGAGGIEGKGSVGRHEVFKQGHLTHVAMARKPHRPVDRRHD